MSCLPVHVKKGTQTHVLDAYAPVDAAGARGRARQDGASRSGTAVPPCLAIDGRHALRRRPFVCAERTARGGSGPGWVFDLLAFSRRGGDLSLTDRWVVGVSEAASLPYEQGCL